MKLSLGWKGFDNFSSSENVFNPYCLNSFEPQKICHFVRISLFVCFMLSVFFDLNQHHLKDPWLEKNMNVETDNFANHPKELLNDRKRSFTCNQCYYTGDRPGNLKKNNMFWFIMVLLAHIVITLPQHPLPSRATR